MPAQVSVACILFLTILPGGWFICSRRSILICHWDLNQEQCTKPECFSKCIKPTHILFSVNVKRNTYSDWNPNFSTHFIYIFWYYFPFTGYKHGVLELSCTALFVLAAPCTFTKTFCVLIVKTRPQISKKLFYNYQSHLNTSFNETRITVFSSVLSLDILLLPTIYRWIGTTTLYSTCSFDTELIQESGENGIA